MRKPLLWICAFLSAFLFASPLWATPCTSCLTPGTWVDLYDPEDIYLNKCGPTRSAVIPLDITGDGFQPGVDKLYRYSIEVRLYDDAGKDGGAGYFEIPGLSHFELFNLNQEIKTFRSDILSVALT